MIRRAFVVRGLVQGVGFRWFVVRSAAAHAVSGWVRNEADGSVAGEAEGLPAALTDFFDRLRRGPRLARVDELVLNELPSLGGSEFVVRE